jgi:hypothetical protein
VHVNTTSGYGNFHMKPNGVFYVSVDRAAVAETRAFLKQRPQADLATQSGPMIDYRWGDGKVDTTRKYATELGALAPDVILALSSAAVAPLLEASRTVPIVRERSRRINAPSDWLAGAAGFASQNQNSPSLLRSRAEVGD